MKTAPNIKVKDLLIASNVEFREHNNELITHCLFNDCDSDSRGNEAHLYINATTGQYFCHKCGEKGGNKSLCEVLGIVDDPQPLKSLKTRPDATKQAKTYHKQLPLNIREWLKNERLLLDEDIDDYELGYGEFYDNNWVTIPVRDLNGNVLFIKLRHDPFLQFDGPKYMSSGGEAALFNIEALKDKPDQLVICEGEFDCLVLRAYGITAITSTAGVRTFKDEWY